MAINLTENVKTYLTYAVTAITGAAVGALILLAGQGINNRLHPKLLASAVTGDMLSAVQGRPVGELREELNTLNEQTPTLTEAQTTAQGQVEGAQRTFDEAQRIVTGAGDAVTEAQQNAVTDAQRALEAAQAAFENAQTALAEHNKRITELQAQIAVNGVLANASQRAELVNRINNLAPAPRTQANT